MHILFQFITRARLTLVDDNDKMAQCQIFIVQNALVHHLFSEIRISHCTLGRVQPYFERINLKSTIFKICRLRIHQVSNLKIRNSSY